MFCVRSCGISRAVNVTYVIQFGQYNQPTTLNPDFDELPAFQLTIKVFERPAYSSPTSKGMSDDQTNAWRTTWANETKASLRMLPPSAPNRLTGRVTIGNHTFCGELEVYLVLLDTSAQNRADFQHLYMNQGDVAQWVAHGHAIVSRPCKTGRDLH